MCRDCRYTGHSTLTMRRNSLGLNHHCGLCNESATKRRLGRHDYTRRLGGAIDTIGYRIVYTMQAVTTSAGSLQYSDHLLCYRYDIINFTLTSGHSVPYCLFASHTLKILLNNVLTRRGYRCEKLDVKGRIPSLYSVLPMVVRHCSTCRCSMYHWAAVQNNVAVE